MPSVVIISGPNGAGKSTTAPFLLKDLLDVNNFVNADVIAQGLCAYKPETASIQAGRIMLDRIHLLADQGQDFAFETTLASKTFLPWIKGLRAKGYKFYLIFLWLNDVSLAIRRVQERVKSGGHFIPEAIISRRYYAGINNFFNLYTLVADAWSIYNNSDIESLSLIASKDYGYEPYIIDKYLWEMLEKNNHERR